MRACGFEVLDLIEIRAPDALAELRGRRLVDPDWARKWPAEQIWRVRKMDRNLTCPFKLALPLITQAHPERRRR